MSEVRNVNGVPVAGLMETREAVAVRITSLLGMLPEDKYFVKVNGELRDFAPGNVVALLTANDGFALYRDDGKTATATQGWIWKNSATTRKTDGDTVIVDVPYDGSKRTVDHYLNVERALIAHLRAQGLMKAPSP